MNITAVSPTVSVGWQIAPEEVGTLATAGFKGIINNRPDGEEPGQPASAEIEEQARQHGLAYWHIPVAPGRITEENVKAMADALRAADGPVLAFCRSGTRSAYLWNLAQQGEA